MPAMAATECNPTLRAALAGLRAQAVCQVRAALVDLVETRRGAQTAWAAMAAMAAMQPVGAMAETVFMARRCLPMGQMVGLVETPVPKALVASEVKREPAEAAVRAENQARLAVARMAAAGATGATEVLPYPVRASAEPAALSAKEKVVTDKAVARVTLGTAGEQAALAATPAREVV